MANDSVVIKISGDIKDFTSKLDTIQKETKDFTSAMNKAGLAAGASFALVTAGAIKAVNAFKDSVRPAAELQNILKNQGIYSEKLVEEYGNIAKELKKITGVDDEIITSGQAVIQRFAGQTKVTKEFTNAILDLAAFAKIDTATAFNLVGKSIGTSTNALSKYGIEIASNLSVQEKMSVFVANANAKFRDQAKVLNETAGPLSRLSDSFGNVVEKLGEKFAPIVDSIAGSLENLANAASENDEAADIIASVGIAIAALGGTILVLSQVATAIVAINAACVTLGVSIGVLTGGIGFVVAALGALGYVALKASKQTGSLEDATRGLAKAKKEIEDIKSRDPRGLALGNELKTAKDTAKFYQDQIDKLNIGNVAAEKKTDIAKKQQEEDQKALANAEKLNKEAEKRKKIEEEKIASIEKEKQAREDLKKSLVDAGKDEMTALEDLRDRRIQIAKNDKELLLLIEKDFQDNKHELEKKNDEKLRDLREAQFEYEKKLIADRNALIAKASGSPIQGFIEAAGETDPEKKLTGNLAAGAGVLNQVGQGKEGARSLITEGAALGIDAFAPGMGQALKPLIGSLTQGPEATREMVKEFTKAIPDIISGLIEAIPAFVEELAIQFPVIIDRLVEKVPDIIRALVASMPKLLPAMIDMIGVLPAAIIRNMPEIIQSFIDGLIDGASAFVNALIDAINPFSSDSGIGGFFSDVGEIFGFAEGGQAAVKRVPSGFSGDRFPAFLSSDELVVKPDVARDLESFLGNQGSGSSYDAGLLNKILKAVSAPVIVNSDVHLKGKAFANIQLQLSRANERLA